MSKTIWVVIEWQCTPYEGRDAEVIRAYPTKEEADHVRSMLEEVESKVPERLFGTYLEYEVCETQLGEIA